MGIDDKDLTTFWTGDFYSLTHLVTLLNFVIVLVMLPVLVIAFFAKPVNDHSL